MNMPEANKLCANCGQPLQPNALFCEHCGATVGNTPAPPLQTPSPPQVVTPTPSRKSKRSWLLPVGLVAVGLCLCLMFVVVGVLVLRKTSGFSLSKRAVKPTLNATQSTQIQPVNPLPSTKNPPSAATQEATPNPTATELGSGVVLSDDFSDPTDGWSVSTSPEYTFEYQQPKGYAILIHKPEYWAFSSRERTFSNLVISVRGKHGPQKGSYFGVICRLKDNQNYYWAEISGDTYEIGKTIDGSDTILTQPAWQKLIDAKPDAEGYLAVAFSCIDDRLGLVVNTIAQPLISDSDLTEGGVALFAGAGKEAGKDGEYGEGYFQDFSISIP